MSSGFVLVTRNDERLMTHQSYSKAPGCIMTTLTCETEATIYKINGYYTLNVHELLYTLTGKRKMWRVTLIRNEILTNRIDGRPT